MVKEAEHPLSAGLKSTVTLRGKLIDQAAIILYREIVLYYEHNCMQHLLLVCMSLLSEFEFIVFVLLSVVITVLLHIKRMQLELLARGSWQLECVNIRPRSSGEYFLFWLLLG